MNRDRTVPVGLVLLLLLSSFASPVSGDRSSVPSPLRGAAELHPPAGAVGVPLSSPRGHSTVSAGWSRISPLVHGPSPRTGSITAYDARDGYVLLFGGADATGGALNDTWAFRAGTWTNLTSRVQGSPPATGAPSLVYDAAGDEAVLFQGASGETWTYGSGVWSQVTGPGPSARWGASLGYAANEGKVVLFGGRLANGQMTNETWTFSAGAWENVSGSVGHAPSPRWGAAVASGPGPTDALYLYGGYNGTLLGDSWSWGSGGWSQLSLPASGIQGRWGGAMAWSPDDGTLFLFGGVEDSGNANDSWLFGGASGWEPVPPTNGPSPRQGASLSSDPWDSDLVLFGGTNASGVTNDTWTWGGARAVTPLSASLLATPSSLDAGGSVQFSSAASGGSPPYSYSWEALPPGCARSSLASFSCTPSSPGTFPISLTVNDSATGTFTATGWLIVNAALSLSSFSALPTALVLGGSTQLTASVQGGTPPLTFSYSGLPPGCSSQNTSSFPCRPTSSGSYVIDLTVRDAAGGSVPGQLTLDISPEVGPSVGLSSSPTGPRPGQLVTLQATVQGGTLPLRYGWTENGSAFEAAGPTWSFLPTGAGNYLFTVNVTDAAGLSSVASTTVAVLPPLPPAITVTVNSSASSVPSGGTVVLTASVTGGAGPFSFTWVLDGTNTSARGATWSVDLEQTGTHRVAVWVAAPGGQLDLSPSVVITVTSSASSGAASGLSATEVWAITGALLAIGIAFALLGLLLRFRGGAAPPRRRGPPSEEPSPTEAKTEEAAAGASPSPSAEGPKEAKSEEPPPSPSAAAPGTEAGPTPKEEAKA
jgi:hypothetical protein